MQSLVRGALLLPLQLWRQSQPVARADSDAMFWALWLCVCLCVCWNPLLTSPLQLQHAWAWHMEQLATPPAPLCPRHACIVCLWQACARARARISVCVLQLRGCADPCLALLPLRALRTRPAQGVLVK